MNERATYVRDKIEEFFADMGISRFSSKIATGFFHSQLAKDDGSAKFARVLTYLHEKIMKRNLPPLNILQRGCPNVFSSLSARPVWDTSDPRLTWVRALEESFHVIRDEFLAARSITTETNAFQPYRSPQPPSISTSSSSAAAPNDVLKDSFGYFATDHGSWNVCYLFLHGDSCRNFCFIPRFTSG